MQLREATVLCQVVYQSIAHLKMCVKCCYGSPGLVSRTCRKETLASVEERETDKRCELSSLGWW